jgi:hypothetical protein
VTLALTFVLGLERDEAGAHRQVGRHLALAREV